MSVDFQKEKKETNNNVNLIVATVLAILAVFVFDYFFPTPEMPETKTAAVQGQDKKAAVPAADEAVVPSLQSMTTAPEATAATPVSREAKIAEDRRIKISNAKVRGSLRLKGARFDDISLNLYRETLNPDSPHIVLFSPAGTQNPYFAEFGWTSVEPALPLPDKNTPWQTSSTELTPEKPLVLTWDNGKGLHFTRTISVDNDYMFTVTDKVTNTGAKEVALNSYGLISRTGAPEEENNFSYISFDGLLGVMQNTLEEIRYADLMEEKQESFTTNDGGWLGITDKYWLSALVFDQKAKDVNTKFSYHNLNRKDVFQADYLLPTLSLASGETLESTNRLFVGAKEINALDAYAEEYNIPRFDLAIDFGWYYFLTKPFLYILDFLNAFLGNMGLAILVFAFLLRVLVFPIANKSYVSMHKMKLLQPKIKELTERYKDNRQKLSQEMMALYKKEKVNPASGCLPALIQIPIFFSLYKVLYIAIELRQAPFYGWIHDLSMPDPTSIFTLCGLINWPVPGFLDIGVWPLIMGITMYIQFKLNPQPADKTQAMVFAWLPVIFTFMLAHFASGLVIYWAWSNILSIIQQRVIIFRMDRKFKKTGKLSQI